MVFPTMAYPHKSRRIAETIAGWFAENRFAPGDRFPSDQELARQFAVTHVTVRTALKRFIDDGLLERRGGVGTVVRAPTRRSEVTAGTGAVALALPDATHSFFSALLSAAEAALLGTNRPLLFGHTWERVAREQQVVSNWLAQNIQHMILTPPVLEAPFYNDLVARGVRLVFVDRRVPGVDVPSIVSRDDVGMGLIVRHLVRERGLRRLVHLAGPSTIWTAQRRRESFQRTALEEGVNLRDLQVCEAGFYADDGHRATMALLASRAPFDAIVAANDPVAVGAVRALQESGFRVPGDVTVTGYGDTDLGRNFGLMTVRQFPERMGAEAVRLVAGSERLDARASIEIAPELVVRAGAADRGPLPAASSAG